MKEISRLLTGRIIWLNSLSPVNLTDFPLEQHTVSNVLNPKSIAKTGELHKTRWTVMLTVGDPCLTPSLYAMDIPCSFSARFSPLFTSKHSDISVFRGEISLISLPSLLNAGFPTSSSEISPEFFHFLRDISFMRDLAL